MEFQELGDQILILKWIQLFPNQDMNGNPRVPRKFLQSPLSLTYHTLNRKHGLVSLLFCELPWPFMGDLENKVENQPYMVVI